MFDEKRIGNHLFAITIYWFFNNLQLRFFPRRQKVKTIESVLWVGESLKKLNKVQLRDYKKIHKMRIELVIVRLRLIARCPNEIIEFEV